MPPQSKPGEYNDTRTVSLDYRFTLKDSPEGAALARVWVPLPSENAHQRLTHYELQGGLTGQVVTETEYGNRYLRIDLPLAGSGAGGGRTVSIDFHVTRSAFRAEPRGAMERVSQELLRRFLSPDRLVPIDGPIEKDARLAAGDASSPLERARRLYDHIVATMKYDKSGTDWGRGDALWACDTRRGNCTDFHSLFIGEARAMKLPARFIMGLPLPEDIKEGPIAGYHCWAEFYIEGTGWVPIDASEAFKHPAKKEELFAGLDANRIQFTVGRDIKLPDASGDRLNYSIYPYVEIDGRPYTKVETSFSFKEIQVQEKGAPAAGAEVPAERNRLKGTAPKRGHKRGRAAPSGGAVPGS